MKYANEPKWRRTMGGSELSSMSRGCLCRVTRLHGAKPAGRYAWAVHASTKTGSTAIEGFGRAHTEQAAQARAVDFAWRIAESFSLVDLGISR